MKSISDTQAFTLISETKCRNFVYSSLCFALMFFCCEESKSQTQFSFLLCPHVPGLVSLKSCFCELNLKSQSNFTFQFSNTYYCIHFSLYHFFTLPMSSYCLAHLIVITIYALLRRVKHSLLQFFCILQQCALWSRDNHRTIDTFRFQSGL